MGRQKSWDMIREGDEINIPLKNGLFAHVKVQKVKGNHVLLEGSNKFWNKEYLESLEVRESVTNWIHDDGEIGTPH